MKKAKKQVGIVGFGAYIPIHRMQKKVIGQMWGSIGGRGEKAVANWDEDSLTMGVEACIDSLRNFERDRIAGVLFASTTPPFREKQSASLIRKVLDLPSDSLTVDFANSLRGGTLGLRMAMDAVRAGSGANYLVAAADLRVSAPNSTLEAEFGDGAASLLIGNKDLLVTINGHYSFTSEFIDTWRRDRDAYSQRWDDRFVLTEGYRRLMVKALKEFFKKQGTGPKDYTRAALYAPNARSLSSVAKATGMSFSEQLATDLLDRVGDTGSAMALMMLVEALEKSQAGDRVLLAGYGDGVDVFDLTVTDKISQYKRGRGVEKHLASGMPLKSYGRYLRFRDLMEWEFDRRAPDRTSLPVLYRESSQIYSLHGGRCRQCGVIQFPIQRVCTECQAKDDFDEVRLSETRGTVFTFSMDERAMVPDLPNVLCIVDLEGGGRYFSVMTDRIPAEVQIGMPVEMTFRRIHDGLSLYNYFWKTRPIRA